MVEVVWRGLAIGALATVVIDIWAVILRKVFAQPFPNFGLIGRWAGHLVELRMFHAGIGNSAPVRAETALGWIVHYTTGMIFGLAFAFLVGAPWFAEPILGPALLFGLFTLVFPWLLLQPALGVGVAASKTPRPWKARFLNLVSHSIFGIGLWSAAMLLVGMGR